MKSWKLFDARAFALLGIATSGCAMLQHPIQFQANADAPAVVARAEGCNVEIYEEGQAVPTDHVELGRATLDWPAADIKVNGPHGAMAALRAAGCERGASFIKDLRVLTRGDQGGVVYEGTLAVLRDTTGKPIGAVR